MWRRSSSISQATIQKACALIAEAAAAGARLIAFPGIDRAGISGMGGSSGAN